MTARIQFFGDLILNGLYNDPLQHGALKENMLWLDAFLGKADFRIVNWESPLWGDGKINELRSPCLTTTQETASQVLPVQFNLATLANNHFFDCRESGLRNTIGFLNDNRIKTMGVGETNEAVAQPLFQEIGGIRFCFLNYVGKETNANPPPDAAFFANDLVPEKVEADIVTNVGQCDHLIILPHWGTYERVRYPEPWQRKLARRWIDLGARLVVGTHAHSLQGWENHKNGTIVYSLGDFLFSSSLSFPGCSTSIYDPLSNQIAVLDVVFDTNSLQKMEFRFLRRDFESLVLREDTGKSRSRALARVSSVLKGGDKKLSRYLKFDRFLSLSRELYRRLGMDQAVKTCNRLRKKLFRHQ